MTILPTNAPTSGLAMTKESAAPRPAGQPQGAPLSVQVAGLVVFPWAVKSIDWVAPAGIVGG